MQLCSPDERNPCFCLRSSGLRRKRLHLGYDTWPHVDSLVFYIVEPSCLSTLSNLNVK